MRIYFLAFTTIFLISCGGGGGGGSSDTSSPSGATSPVTNTPFDMTYFLGNQSAIAIEFLVFKTLNNFPLDMTLGRQVEPIPGSCDSLSANQLLYYECTSERSDGTIGQQPIYLNKFICMSIFQAEVLKYNDQNGYLNILDSSLSANNYQWIIDPVNNYELRRYGSIPYEVSSYADTYSSENSISLNASSQSIEQIQASEAIEELSATMKFKFPENANSCVDEIDLNIFTINDGYIVGFSDDGYGVFGYPRDSSVEFEAKDFWGEYDVYVSEMNISSRPTRIGEGKFKFQDELPPTPLNMEESRITSAPTTYAGFAKKFDALIPYPDSGVSNRDLNPNIYIGFIGNNECPDFSQSYIFNSNCRLIPKTINIITSFKDEIISFDLESNYLITGVKTLYVQ